MTNNLDTLATALYVETDDLLKAAPHLGPRRPAVGTAPKPSDAELVTLAVMQALPGFTGKARWLRHAHAHLRHLFPCLPQQPGYNRRLGAAASLIRRIVHLASDTTLGSDTVWIVDSTPVAAAQKETAKRSDLAGWAEYGYCASHSRFFRGLRLHLICTPHGLPVALALTEAKAVEREVLLDTFATEPKLLRSRPGQSLLADKNYYGRTPEGVTVRILHASSPSPPPSGTTTRPDNPSTAH